jgi:hypothetical protein
MEFKILLLFLLALEITFGKILIDLIQLQNEKVLHNKLFDILKEKDISPSPSTTTKSYEDGIIACFGDKTTTPKPKMEQFLKANVNAPMPALCNMSFSEMTLEQKMYCFAILALWVMLMLSAIMYQIRTMMKVRNAGIGILRKNKKRDDMEEEKDLEMNTIK